MKNITISLSDELAHRAKIYAAENNTSVSRYMGEILMERLEEEQGYKKAMKQWCGVSPSAINEDRAQYPAREDLYDR